MTVEKMITAVKSAPDKKERHKLFDSFRLMHFYGLLDEEIFEAFCTKWAELELYK